MTSTGSPRRVPPGKVKLISAWFFLFAGVWGILGARAILILAGLSVGSGNPYLANFGISFGSSVDVAFAAEASFLIGFGLLNGAVGVGLLRLRQWARWLAIGLAAPGLILYPLQLSPSPVAFMAGGLIIWYLFTPKSPSRSTRPTTPDCSQREYACTCLRLAQNHRVWAPHPLPCRSALHPLSVACIGH